MIGQQASCQLLDQSKLVVQSVNPQINQFAITGAGEDSEKLCVIAPSEKSVSDVIYSILL
jgi:hypothetical protein